MSKRTDPGSRIPTATVAFQSEEEKERFRSMAESYGLTLSSYLKMAAIEYSRLHPWDHEKP